MLAMFTEIFTERLVLRDLRPADAELMFGYHSDPTVSLYQSWEPKSVEELHSFIARLATMKPGTPSDWYQIGIALRSTGELLGDCGLHVPAADPAAAEIGITLAPTFQNHGYATEAMRGVIEYLFATMCKHRVFCSVDSRNLRSMALMQRVGFRQESHSIKSLWFKGEWADDVIFAMTPGEWESIRGRA
jgi:RimJ/RimL family protein N-acetyltransferase